jgi:hypothetical protein
MGASFGPEPCIYKHWRQTIDNISGHKGEMQFANGQSSRDLRVDSGNLHERIDSSGPLEALRLDSDEVLERQIEVPNGLNESPAAPAEVHGTVA